MLDHRKFIKNMATTTATSGISPLAFSNCFSKNKNEKLLFLKKESPPKRYVGYEKINNI